MTDTRIGFGYDSHEFKPGVPLRIGGLTLNHPGASGYPEQGYIYFKMGLYRDVMQPPMTVYIDEYRKRQLRDDEF